MPTVIPRAVAEQIADELVEQVLFTLTARVRSMLAEDLARLRPVLVAGLEAGANPRVFSPYFLDVVLPRGDNPS